MGAHRLRNGKLLMKTETVPASAPEKRRFSKTKAAVGTTIAALFASLSAIASVNLNPAPDAEGQISQQILLIEDQEANLREARRFERLLEPRGTLAWRRTSFKTVSNPVLLAEMTQIERTRLHPERLTFAALSYIQDISAATEVPPLDDVAPALALAPKRRGQAQWHCLAEAVYFEARSESLIAQKAVAEVIMNRVDSSRYPNTVCEVINQGASKKHRCQFSYNCDGLPETIHEKRAWQRAKSVAQEIVAASTRPLTNGATHYHTTAVRPYWSRRLVRTGKFGSHIFYKRGTQLTRR